MNIVWERADDAAAGLARHSRYVGVGLHPAGSKWSQVAAVDALRAEIIVVVESATGEVRQCGKLSGYCVSMNPWTRKPSVSQIAPIPLIRHADQLAGKAAAAGR